MSKNKSMSNSSRSSTGESSLSDGIAGCCNVSEGDHIGDNYKAIEQLGSGRFSTVWECKNEKDGKSYAIKIQRNTKNYSKLADEEIALYERMNGPLENVLSYHGNFVHKEEEGCHKCLVFDIMDTTLMELIDDEEEGISLDTLKDIIRQILNGVNNLHEVGIIHTDLKPENILVKWDENKKINIAIADLGSGCDASNKEIFQFGTREYRSPEAILEIKFDKMTDIWSVGCIVYELITGEYLFDPHKYYDDEENTCGRHLTAESYEDRDYCLDHLQLHTMIAILGEIPRRVSKNSEIFKDHFNRDGTIKDKKLDRTTIKRKLMEEHEINDSLATEIEDFLLKIFKYRRHERATASKLLTHPFLKTKK